jgi:hypothetical protein
MNKILLKLGTGISVSALVATSFLSPASALNVTISGNGASSDNEVEVENKSEVKVEQENEADIDNEIEVEANTGDNEAKWNTGGDVVIDTGDSTTNVTVKNKANANVAEVETCCPGDLNLTIKDNGAWSENEIEYKSDHEVDLEQENDADIDNDVDVEAKTGDNEANSNTGGKVEVTTGSVVSTVTVENMVNANVARLLGAKDPAMLSVEIAGNGADSENEVEIDLESEVELEQENEADIDNEIEAEFETGDNEAKWNTGGEVGIDTGDIDSNVDVSTLANFNWADLDACGCPFDEDSTVLIKDNGAFSDNEFELEEENEVDAEQENEADVENDEIEVEGDTGDNEVRGSTASDDPSIETGASNHDVKVENEVNSNVINGEDVDLELPGDLGELADLLAALLALLS